MTNSRRNYKETIFEIIDDNDSEFEVIRTFRNPRMNSKDIRMKFYREESERALENIPKSFLDFNSGYIQQDRLEIPISEFSDDTRREPIDMMDVEQVKRTESIKSFEDMNTYNDPEYNYGEMDVDEFEDRYGNPIVPEVNYVLPESMTGNVSISSSLVTDESAVIKTPEDINKVYEQFDQSIAAEETSVSVLQLNVAANEAEVIDTVYDDKDIERITQESLPVEQEKAEFDIDTTVGEKETPYENPITKPFSSNFVKPNRTPKTQPVEEEETSDETPDDINESDEEDFADDPYAELEAQYEEEDAKKMKRSRKGDDY